jgi:hypothetical protein
MSSRPQAQRRVGLDEATVQAACFAQSNCMTHARKNTTFRSSIIISMAVRTLSIVLVLADHSFVAENQLNGISNIIFCVRGRPQTILQRHLFREHGSMANWVWPQA